MSLSFSIIMCGGSIHGRCLLQRLIKNHIKPKLIIIETGTLRAKRHKQFLREAITEVPQIEDLIKDIAVDVFEVSDYNGNKSVEILKTSNIDIGINGGADIFSETLLKTVNNYFLNAHPGLLPEYRGLDPVLWALLERKKIGATLHKINKDIDSGDIFLKKELKMKQFYNILDIRLACIELCADLVVEFLKNPNKYEPYTPILSPKQIRGKFNPKNYHLVEKAFKERHYESD